MSGSRLEIGAVAAWVVFLAAVIGSGAVVVAALRATGVLDLTDDPGGVAAYDQASCYSCPDGDCVGAFVRGNSV